MKLEIRHLLSMWIIIILAVGCGNVGIRKMVSGVAQGSADLTMAIKNHCVRLAKEGCKTDPCPALKNCKAAERYATDGAMALVMAGQHINRALEAEGGSK